MPGWKPKELIKSPPTEPRLVQLEFRFGLSVSMLLHAGAAHHFFQPFQSTCLIGFGSNYREGANDGTFDYKQFFGGDEGERVMINNFIDYVHSLRSELAIEKTSMAKPIFLTLSEVQLAHQDFFELKELGEEEWEGSWGGGLTGQFETHLEKKCRDLHIFAMNGSKYDFPIILKPLTVELKRRNIVVRLIRAGSAVSRISWKCGGGRIIMSDMSSLVSPGVSLKHFAKLTGLATKKGLFPFGAFQSLDFLKRTELPPNREMWFDPLSQSSPSQEEIDEARREFKRLSCATIKDYLSHYLYLDLKILGLASIRFLTQMYREFHCHVCDNSKLTIASYAFVTWQKELVRQKRIGTYFPNIVTIYGAIRNSALGGLSCVFKHLSVPETAPPGIKSQTDTTSAVHYYDVNRRDIIV